MSTTPEDGHDYILRDVMTAALRTSVRMAACIVEDLARSPLILDDLDGLDLPYELRSEVLDRVTSNATPAWLDRLGCAVNALWVAGEGMDEARDAAARIAARNGAPAATQQDEGDNDLLDGTTIGMVERAHSADLANEAARRARGERGAARNAGRVAEVVRRSCDEYGVPGPLRPHFIRIDADTVECRWYPGETRDRAGGRRALRPNGRERISISPDAIGGMPPATISWLAGFMQRTLLVTGRDYEIDAHEVPLSAAPPWCTAASLPIARLVRSGAADAGRFGCDCGILSTEGVDLGDGVAATLACDPLTWGAYLWIKAQLPDVIMAALPANIGHPLRRVVDHDAFADDRILLAGVRRTMGGEILLLIDAPVVRLREWPPELQVVPDPVEAWMGYARAMDAPAFYRRQNEATGGGFASWSID